MCHLTRIPFFFVLSLGFGLAPSLLCAQQLHQPASVLPWRATQPEAKLALNSPVKVGPKKSSEKDSPAWLIEAAKPIIQEPSAEQDLPSVEKESFADLGQLHRYSAAQKTKSIRRSRSSHSASKESFNLFRALGIKANRAGNRR